MPHHFRTAGPFCHRALLTLEEKHVPYTSTLIDFNDNPQWLLDLNPSGSVPVMNVLPAVPRAVPPAVPPAASNSFIVCCVHVIIACMGPRSAARWQCWVCWRYQSAAVAVWQPPDSSSLYSSPPAQLVPPSFLL